MGLGRNVRATIYRYTRARARTHTHTNTHKHTHLQASTGFARNVRASLGVFGSGSTALVRSDKDDDEKPLKLPAAVKSAPARTTVGAGAGNNDEEIFVKSTAGMR